MRKLAAIIAVSALACAPAALAQETLIIVDLSGISADLATTLEIDVEEVPTTVDLSPSLAAVICDVDETSLVDSCTAVFSSDDLVAFLQDDDEDGEDGGPSANSAAEFAPGHQDGPARDFAPGQQEGDAKDFAPGQVKKDTGDDTDDIDDADEMDDTDDSDDGNGGGNSGGNGNSDDAPGHNK